jgi:hypothetical protein
MEEANTQNNQRSLFEFAKPNDIEQSGNPDDDEIRSILRLGLLSIFTSQYEKASDRIKAASELAKIIGDKSENKEGSGVLATIRIIKAEGLDIDS